MTDQYILSPFFLDNRQEALAALADSDWRVLRPEVKGDDLLERVSRINEVMAQEVTAQIGAGKRPVCVAGDCCCSLGVLAGLQRAGLDVTVVWIDAHGDFNTFETTPTGFLGGMPLAMMVGIGNLAIPQTLGLKPQAQRKVILSDARDLDPQEAELLSGSRVIHLKKLGELETIPLPNGPIYVHFDTDVITAREVPAQRYPVRTGPQSQEVKAAFARLAQSERIVAVSMSCWHAEQDEDGVSRDICLSTLEALLG